jgi:hypothetical protein
MSVYDQKSLWEETVSAVTATPSEDLGTHRYFGGNEYIYAYNAGGDANKNRIVILTGATGYSFVVTYVTGTGAVLDKGNTVLGVVQHATIAAGSYGWICTRGWVDVAASGSSVVAIAAGDALINGLDGFVRSYTFTSEVTQAVAKGILGYAAQTTTTTGVGAMRFYLK